MLGLALGMPEGFQLGAGDGTRLGVELGMLEGTFDGWELGIDETLGVADGNVVALGRVDNVGNEVLGD